jgi:hypothetical protein
MKSLSTRRDGAALVIVLSFVILLLFMLMAFFSKSLLQQQVSKASASYSTAHYFALGALETVVGDLRSEIADGSVATNVVVNAGGTNMTNALYLPSTPFRAVPQPVGIATNASFVNLIKTSTNQPFYSFTNVSGVNRASTISTTNPSLNSRSITPLRWNKPGLLPMGNPASGDLDPSTLFVPPAWIYVSRGGGNPATWSRDLRWSVTNSTTVIGRYAYAVYNEGGLLNVNVAGYPPPTLLGAASSNMTSATIFKGTPVYADLSQFVYTNSGTATRVFSDSDILALLNWRDSVTLSNAPSASSVSNYISAVGTVTNGFLSPMTNTLGDSDRMFVNRQQLIAFLSGSLPQTDPAARQYALYYLGTFSRGLEQPGYAPPTNRPLVISGSGGNDAYGVDQDINVSFLTNRVTNGFTRSDLSKAIPGEPLVKKRFPLNRLAWITFKGPSAENISDPVVQATITALGGNPLNPKDPVYQFVAQGNKTNIFNTFGLSWIDDPVHPGSKEWVYSHAGVNPVTAVPSTPQRISRLNQVAGREPDFFELLKATLTMGSLGKAYGTTNDGTGGYGLTRSYCATRDQSVEAQVFQIGANIIDQADVDGYPTRILYNIGLQGVPGQTASFSEAHGVEDLPYLYRIREAMVRIKESVPAYTNSPTTNVTTVTDPGQGVMLQQPEVWNPHAWSGSDLSNRPVNFRVIALSCYPTHTSDTVSDGDSAANKISLIVNFATLASTFKSPATTPTNMSAADTELLFEIPAGSTNALFREPTMLIKPGVPNNSNLRAGTGHAIRTLSAAAGGPSDYLLSVDAAGSQGGYFAYPSPLTDDRKYLGFVLGNATLPMIWATNLYNNAISGINGNRVMSNNPTPGIVHAQYPYPVAGDLITYRLQYSDPANPSAWLTYDEKAAPVLAQAWGGQWPSGDLGAGNSTAPGRYMFAGNCIGGYNRAVTAVDPRTTRFGWHIGGRGASSGLNTFPIAPMNPSTSSQAWWRAADAAQNMVMTARPDQVDGSGNLMPPGGNVYWCAGGPSFLASAVDCPPSALGWYPRQGSAMAMFPGYLSQNNPSAGTTGVPYNAVAPPLIGFADPDGVFRRAMGAYPQPSLSVPLTVGPNGSPSGQPLRTAYKSGGGGSTLGEPFTLQPAGNTITSQTEPASRPIVLNRPFKSVAELGAVFSDTPWRNLDFFTPESGSAALLDVFCVRDTTPPSAISAGKVDLNTRQAPVLQSILAGSYINALSPTNPLIATNNVKVSAQTIANAIVQRTQGTNAGYGPYANIADIVGRWNSQVSIPNATSPFLIDGGKSYVGFSGLAATGTNPVQTPPNLSYLLYSDSSVPGYTSMVVQRYREATVRALSDTCQTRVWNLLIDLVAQTGKFSPGANSLQAFTVEGEQRFWLHVAIDRLTGQVIDSQLEVVTE